MKILIADDNRTTHLVLLAVLENQGHEIISAYDGLTAIDMFERVHPDLILMDVLMPRLDGLEAAKEIKKRSGYKFVPIIFVTVDDSAGAITKCIESGGDDFIVKPIDPEILQAKITAMSRICALHDGLLTHRLNLDNELDVANHVFETILDQGRLDLPCLTYRTQAASQFCSDLLLCKGAPAGGINFLLADFGGYGLSAAMSSIPVLDIFYSMTGKGFSVEDIVVELNNKLKSIFPANMFCAALIGSIDPERSSVTIWNGGMPDVLVTTAEGKVVNRITSSHLALGVASSSSFDRSVEIAAIDVHSRLYILSDGLLEERNSEGERFGEKRLEKLLASNKSGMISVIFDDLYRHSDGANQVDDITVGEIYVHAIEHEPSADKNERFLAKTPSVWSVSLSFDAVALRDLNVVPIILNLVMDVQAPVGHRERLFTVISELYNNALEHGVLKLDSKMKLDQNGFVSYYEERSSRLAKLSDGNIKIDVRNESVEEGGRLTITVLDSGEGFDYQSTPENIEANMTLSGRGIAMVYSLCSKVEYSENGTKVSVIYDW